MSQKSSYPQSKFVPQTLIRDTSLPHHLISTASHVVKSSSRPSTEPPATSETAPLPFKTTGRIKSLMMRKDASEIRQKLLEHGVMLLMDQGYHGTGLQELVQSVGVPKGSFYNYFVSKEAFSAEVVRHYIEPFINRLDFHLGKKGTTAEKALKAYFKELIDDTEQKNFKGGCLLGNLIGEIGETDDLCQIALKEAVHRYRDALKEAIARGQKDGSFRNDLSATQMADVLVNFWQGALLRMKVERSVRPLTQFCDLMLNHYFKA